MTERQQAVQVRAVIIFLFVVSVGVLAFGVIELLGGYRAQSWARIPARIQELRFRSIAVTYEYRVDGTALNGTQVCFGLIGDKERKKLDQLSVGREVEVSVNLRDPKQSTLYPGITSGAWAIAGFGIFGVLISGTAGLLAWRHFRND